MAVSVKFILTEFEKSSDSSIILKSITVEFVDFTRADKNIEPGHGEHYQNKV